MISLLLAIITHELGHLLGGLCCGYSFTMIEILGIVLYRREGQMKMRYERNIPIGQCLMYSHDLSRNPRFMILGGCMANVIVGTLFLLIGMSQCSLIRTLLCIFFGGINLLLGIANLVSESSSSDGATYRDATAAPERAEIYNRLMLVYMHLENGSGYCGIPEDILTAPVLHESPLAAELAVYRYYRLRDLSREDHTLDGAAERQLLELAGYSPKTGVAEVLHGL